MSWFFKSFRANYDDDFTAELRSNSSWTSPECSANPSVKDDLTALGESRSGGVASFLAPQSPPPAVAVVAAVESSDSSWCTPTSPASRGLQGIRNDLAELGGSLKAGLMMLSVGEISRFASNLLPFRNRSSNVEDEEEDEKFEDKSADATLGITEDVLDFVTDISSRPECWIEYFLEVDDTDFEMSDIQSMHISIVEQLIPNVSALRIKLERFMSNEQFWMIYFTMLLSKFNEHDHDLEILSSPKIIAARDIIVERFQRKERAQVTSDLIYVNNLVSGVKKEENICANNLVSGVKEENICANNLVGGAREENMVPSGEKAMSTQIIKRSEESEMKGGDGDQNSNQRLEKGDGKERVGFEYISFSDMENDGSNFSGRFSATKSAAEFGGWVKLQTHLDSKKDRDSEDGETSEWLNVDEFYLTGGRYR